MGTEEEKNGEPESKIPYLYWWFIKPKESYDVCAIASFLFSELKRDCPDFLLWLKQTFTESKVSDLNEIYTRAYSKTLADRETLHVTARYNGNHGNSTEAKNFHDRPEVHSSLNQPSDINIIGFFMTPNTYGARVRLGESQLAVYDQDDEATGWKDRRKHKEDADDPFLTFLDKLEAKLKKEMGDNSDKAKEEILAVEVTADPQSGGSEVIVVDRTCEIEHYKDFPDPGNILVVENITVRLQDPGILGNFKPLKGFGSRAHITLGCAKDVPPVVTGFDLIELVKCEQAVADEKSDFVSFGFPYGWLRFYGSAGCMFYPKEQFFVPSVYVDKE